MKSMTEFSIKNNRITLVIVFILMLAGLVAYTSLPKAQDPGFTVRIALITTQFAGASPERVEELVSDQIENVLQTMPEIKKISSENRTGISIVTAEFKQNVKDMQAVFDDMRRKVEDVKQDLPQGTSGPFVNTDFGDVFGSVYILTGDGYNNAELKDIADDIRDELLREPDIAKVNIHGARDEAIFVEYNNARLRELGLSPQQLSGILGSVNILSTGGSVLSGTERIALEPTGNFESLDDLKKTVINLPNNGGLVYLEDIANIYRDYIDPPPNLSRANGAPAMAIAIALRDGGDILTLGERLNTLIPQIEHYYPYGIRLESVWFQADLVKKNVDDFTSNLFQAIGIVLLVMVFTLGLRTGLVVAALIPLTMIITFFVMQQFNITVNQISLAALIIALGLLVDNAIVIVETVLVKRERGTPAVQAAIEAGKEMYMPLLISSLTTAAAFMPIGTAESAVGEYTADIFYVVAIALIISFILSMTLIPMLTTVALNVQKKTNTEQNVSDDELKFNGIIYKVYRPILKWCVHHKLIFFIFVGLIFYSAVFAFKFVPQIFIAPSQDPVFTGKLELPLGTSIETTQSVVEDLDSHIKKTFYDPECKDLSTPKMKNWLMFIGEGGPRMTLSLDPPNPNPANTFMIANTCKGEDVEPIISELSEYITNHQPDMLKQLARLSNGPPVSYPISLRILGPEYTTLYDLADEVTRHLYSLPDVTEVKNSWGLLSKKLIVDVDQDRAQRAGVSSNDVAYSLNASLSGIDLTQFREDNKIIPVTLRTVADDRQDMSKLDGMSVYSQSTGQSVPLKQVADVKLGFQPGLITRRNKQRSMQLDVQLKQGVTATEVNAVLLPWLKEQAQQWPERYTFEVGGESESSDEANASIGAKLPVAFLIIIMLLVIQFNSVRRPIIILTTIPLGIIGVAYGLNIGQSSFGFFTILGIIALSGIIINNAIVLLDRIKVEIQEHEKSAYQAVIHSCQERLRPILLTTATTVGGMLPLWISGSAMFKPMAVTIIFGLLFATMLTLLVVPVLYSVFFRVQREG